MKIMQTNFRREKHGYYYQVQMLIFMTESSAAHFVVWTPSDFILITVKPDYEFWKKKIIQQQKFS